MWKTVVIRKVEGMCIHGTDVSSNFVDVFLRPVTRPVTRNSLSEGFDLWLWGTKSETDMTKSRQETDRAAQLCWIAMTWLCELELWLPTFLFICFPEAGLENWPQTNKTHQSTRETEKPEKTIKTPCCFTPNRPEGSSGPAADSSWISPSRHGRRRRLQLRVRVHATLAFLSGPFSSGWPPDEGNGRRFHRRSEGGIWRKL